MLPVLLLYSSFLFNTSIPLKCLLILVAFHQLLVRSFLVGSNSIVIEYPLGWCGANPKDTFNMHTVQGSLHARKASSAAECVSLEVISPSRNVLGPSAEVSPS
jgi:hypothetical protein